MCHADTKQNWHYNVNYNVESKEKIYKENIIA